LKTFKIEDNDIIFDAHNNLIMVDETDEQLQSIERIMTTNINEWFLDSEFGFDYSLIQTKQFNIELIRLGLIDAVLQDSRVIEVLNIDIEFINIERKIIINFEFITSEGINNGQVIL
jgi:hypothetical protein